MQYPYPNTRVGTSQGTIALDAYVQYVVNAINAKQVIPFGDFGGPNVYYFQTFDNGLGNLVYTIFDKETTLGLASFMVRYGAAATIGQVIFGQWPKSQIDLQYLILPPVPLNTFHQGSVTP